MPLLYPSLFKKNYGRMIMISNPQITTCGITALGSTQLLIFSQHRGLPDASKIIRFYSPICEYPFFDVTRSPRSSEAQLGGQGQPGLSLNHIKMINSQFLIIIQKQSSRGCHLAWQARASS